MNDYTTFLQDDSFVIFLFHGVITERRHDVRNYTAKHMLLENFRGILKALKGAGAPVSMDRIVAAGRGDVPLPKRSFAVTFDDGFANNARIAAPVLKEFNMPAMFYLTTDFLDANGASWSDMIEYAVEMRRAFSLDASYGPLAGAYEGTKERIGFLEKVRSWVKTNDSIDPYGFADRLMKSLAVAGFEPDPELDDKMQWEEARALASDPLFQLGGHTRTHRIMAFLSAEGLKKEIEWSLGRLREEIGQPIEHYSYPEGMPHCYDDRVISELKKNGITCCPTAETGINHVGDDLFRLKRVMVV